MKVFVYFNLNQKLWSIRALEGEHKGRVIGHAKHVELTNVTPKVSEAGRQRVLREKQKNVHAGLVGELVYADTSSPKVLAVIGQSQKANCGAVITYNPYRYQTFVEKSTEKPITSASFVIMNSQRQCLASELRIEQ